MTQTFGQPHHAFLTKRFDRQTTDHDRQRQHFASALTMLGHSEGDDHRAGASYLEIAQWIIQNQNETDEDLLQLWRRIVFSICVSNRDEHLRNHGFLLTEKGWRLSPAYDLNPDPQGTGLSSTVLSRRIRYCERDHQPSERLGESVANHCESIGIETKRTEPNPGSVSAGRKMKAIFKGKLTCQVPGYVGQSEITTHRSIRKLLVVKSHQVQ